ncbi:MAG: hypothetical protein JXR31_10360, partial [Prolixibacteraceae bacterium]|nr:hypothetical protein [Prolixibacteraceae bacterium]
VFIKKVLKPGGIFIFDVLNDRGLEQKVSPKSWETAEKGHWRNSPYLALSESFLYEKEKVILYQHTIIDESGKTDVYRFWTHFFSDSDLKIELQNCGFKEFTFHNNVLPETDIWNGKNVTFCVSLK